jgi:hypothetical protein
MCYAIVPVWFPGRDIEHSIMLTMQDLVAVVDGDAGLLALKRLMAYTVLHPGSLHLPKNSLTAKPPAR